MKRNKILNLLIFLLVVLPDLACQSTKDKNAYHVYEGKYKEILEKTFTKQIDPKTVENSVYKKTSEVLYIYQGNLLKEKNLTNIAGQRELKTKELFNYSNEGRITERQVFLAQRNSLYIKEIFNYDDEGKWVSRSTKDSNGKIVNELKVTKRQQGIVEGEGIENRGKIRFQVKNDGRDSIAFLDVVRKGKEMSRKCEYKKDKYGNLIFEKCIQLYGDSLHSIVTSQFEMDSKNKEWIKKTSEKKLTYIDGKKYYLKDSIIRMEIFSSDQVDTKKVNILGVWEFEDKGNWIDFQDNSKFTIHENSRISSNGNWKLEDSKKQIILKFQTGDNEGDAIIWKIESIYEDLLKIETENNSKYLKRKKTG